MKEEIIKAVEECCLGDYVIENYNNMPIKTVRRLLILLAQYFTSLCDDHSENLIDDIVTYYHEDFE